MKNFDSFPMFLTEDTLVEFWKQYFQEHPEGHHLQLYIHYPWCMNICKFCVFGQCKYHDYKDIIPDYEKAMIRQIQKLNEVFDVVTPDDLYLGGGTASLWSKNFLREMKSALLGYDKIPWKQTEVHPTDLTERKALFYADEMRFDRISIGIQSFDHLSNKGQNRIPVNTTKLIPVVKLLQERGVFVNLDLVALFNLEGDFGWSIFEADLQTASSVVEPDSIFAELNFKNKDFYWNSFKFRRILINFLKKYPKYHITNSQALSLNYEDIIRYRDLPYELVRGTSPVLSQDEFMTQRKDEIIMGLGGINDFTAYSKTPDGFYINAKYIPHDKEFIYTLTKHDKFQHMNSSDENDLYNTRVQVGSYTINPPRRISE